MKLDEYYDYELDIGYFIVHYLDSKRKIEERVSNEEFVNAINKLIDDPNRPYSILFKYYARAEGIGFQEIPKEVYAELYKWKTKLLNRQKYINKTYINNFFYGSIEEISSNYDLEKEVIHRLQEENLIKKLKKALTNKQYLIFFDWYYNRLTKSEIARKYCIKRQTINSYFIQINKKIKKVLK